MKEKLHDMSETTTTREASLESARRDLMIAGGVAVVVMLGAALFAPQQHLWGVALGALLSLVNLAVLARIGVELLGNDEPKIGAVLKAVAKVLALGVVVIAVLYTRPHLALGLCIGLALPALAGVLLVVKGSGRRAAILRFLRGGETRD